MDLDLLKTQLTNAYNFLYGTSLLANYGPKTLTALATILSNISTWFANR